MIILKNKDFLSCQFSSLIADYDRNTITRLYQPIIGFSSAMVYFTLWSESESQKLTPLISHDSLLIRMKMASGEFVEARQKLEAIGLLKTKLEKHKDFNVYHYEIFAPKTPEQFFKDNLLYGLLKENVGKDEALKLKNYFSILDKNTEGEDISCNFIKVFHPNLDSGTFDDTISKEKLLGRKVSKIDSEFSYERFIEELAKISQIMPDAITKNEFKEIERISTLYGVKEDVAAHAVNTVYDSSLKKGNRINSTELANILIKEIDFRFISIKSAKNDRDYNYVSSTTDLGNKINLLESKSPREYLSFLQNATIPADPDLKLINDLSYKFKLPNSVINVVIDIVLTTNSNILSKAYCEKLCGTFAREGIKTALDAMNFYNNQVKKKRNPYKTYINNSQEEEASKDNKESDASVPINNKEEIEDEEWDKLLEKIEGDK
ncbi:MAG: hypothetical protein ACI31G_01060 [Bacilli bacterium]